MMISATTRTKLLLNVAPTCPICIELYSIILYRLWNHKFDKEIV